MATKSKLELAVEEHVGTLNDAQREIVLSQLADYRQNKLRLSRIKDELESLDARAPSSIDEIRFRQSQRASLAYEQNQLSTANSKISSDLFNMFEE